MTRGRPHDGQRVALVLDGHGWASRAVVRSLGQAGWFVLAPAQTKSARSRFCSAAVALPDYKQNVAGFAAAVAGILRAWNVDLVAPAEDGSLELVYETEGLLGGARVLGGDRESARLALDKAATLERARAAGFAVPPTVVPQSVEEGVSACRELGFPCVIKPRRSYVRQGNRLISGRLRFAFSPSEARAALHHYWTLGFERPLVQGWIQGRSIGVAMVVRHGRVLAWGAREAFSQLPVSGGSAVWRATVSEQEPGVREALELFVHLGFEGLGDVQYHIAADGTPTLMEIGARTYGWLPLTIAAGADLPRIAAEALEGREPERPVVARPGLHMRWLRGEAARLAEIARLRPRLPPGARRRDVVRQLWPLAGRSILYDGVMSGDRRWPGLT